jgi:hypothetical protein
LCYLGKFFGYGCLEFIKQLVILVVFLESQFVQFLL